MITSIRGSIHQGHEAFSEHSRGLQCAFMSLAALLFNRSNSVDLWTQTNIDDISLKDIVVTYNERSKVVTNILRPYI